MTFTPRQQDVIAAIRAGHTTSKKLCSTLCITRSTAKKHLENIYRAAAVDNMPALVLWLWNQEQPPPAPRRTDKMSLALADRLADAAEDELIPVRVKGRTGQVYEKRCTPAEVWRLAGAPCFVWLEEGT